MDIVIKNELCHYGLLVTIIKHVGYNDKFISYIFSEDNMKNDHCIDKYLLTLLFDLMNAGYKPTIENVNCLVAYEPCKAIFNDECFNVGSIKDFVDTCKNGKFDTYIIPLIEALNVIPNNDTIIACAYNENTSLIDTLILKYNLIPDKMVLDQIVKQYDMEAVTKILNYKMVPDDETFNNLINDASSKCNTSVIVRIVELLITYGLQINTYHIQKLLALHEPLQNLERFNIKYDEDLYFLCYVGNYYPNEYIDKFTIDKNVIMMRRLKIKRVKLLDFVKKNNLTIDRYTMESLFLERYKEYGELFLTHNITVDNPLSLHRACNKDKQFNKRIKNFNDMCSIIIKQNNITKEYMMKEYQV